MDPRCPRKEDALSAVWTALLTELFADAEYVHLGHDEADLRNVLDDKDT